MLDQETINLLRAKPVTGQSLLIDGKHRPASDGKTSNVISPIDGTQLATVAEATPSDVDDAVSIAKAAFEDGRWSRMAPAARKRIMHRWADLIEAQALDIAVLGVRDNGTEIGMAINAEPGSASATIRYYAEAIDKVGGEISPSPDNVMALVHREPIGVVGVIVPWNFPMMIGAWKIGPALAAGNSVVMKPPESASLSLIRMAELAHEAGLPDGVLNVVTGQGSVVGEAIGLHMDIDVVTFTGSGATGRKLLDYSARSNLKRCYLELGGKSPNVVFADAPNLEEAARVAAFGIFRNSGQVCIAGSRLIVEKSIHEDFVRRVIEIAEGMKVGDPLDVSTSIGAVHSETQLQSNLAFVDKAKADGNTVVSGGERILEDTGGFYMAPTVIDNVDPKDSAAQKEAFGPILSVTPFEGLDAAIRIANDSDFGLAGAVWTSDVATAHIASKRIKAGLMHVNTYGGSDVTVPMAGMKQSGNGADKSLHAIDKYTDLKTVWMKL